MLGGMNRKPRYFTGSCTAVKCPAHSSGTDVASGCACVAGCLGTATEFPLCDGETVKQENMVKQGQEMGMSNSCLMFFAVFGVYQFVMSGNVIPGTLHEEFHNETR